MTSVFVVWRDVDYEPSTLVSIHRTPTGAIRGAERFMEESPALRFESLPISAADIDDGRRYVWGCTGGTLEVLEVAVED